MGVKGKIRAREERRKKKRDRKAANVALWESRMRSGTNTRSTTYKRVRPHRSRHDHAQGPCGNVGCPRCNPIAANLLTPCALHRLSLASRGER